MFLSRAQILAAQDRKFTEVDVPEWGGKVRIQSLDADQQITHERLLKRSDAPGAQVNLLASLAAASIVDAEGAQMFSEKDLSALGKKNPRALLKVVDAIRLLNKDPDDKPGAEGSEENPSAASQRSDSPSDSA